MLIAVCAVGATLLFAMRNHPALIVHPETQEIFMGTVLSLVGLLPALVPPQRDIQAGCKPRVLRGRAMSLAAHATIVRCQQGERGWADHHRGTDAAPEQFELLDEVLATVVELG